MPVPPPVPPGRPVPGEVRDSGPDPQQPVRVLVADDSDGVRELLVLLLDMESGFTVVGQAGDGVDAVSLAEQLQPDVVILDNSMPRLDGIDALPQVHAVSPASHVVIFSGDDERRIEDRARAAGAVAVVAKEAGAPSLIDRLCALFAGPPLAPATG